MILKKKEGFTLIELLISITIIALVVGSATYLLSAVLSAHEKGIAGAELNQEGLLIMDRITYSLRKCTYLLIPNSHNTTRDILAFSGKFNDDNDYYFNDPLFPRIDEDPGYDMNNDLSPGIKNYDDNGDGIIDNGGTGDDDEDGLIDEDPLDGIDNDSDGNIDEDFANDSNSDNEPGISGMNDDRDWFIDEGNSKDDDEDGSFEEDPLNPIIYKYNSGAGSLEEIIPHLNTSVTLSSRVTNFQVKFENAALVKITLSLTDNFGKTVTFVENVFPRNVLQKTGKRVR